MVHCLFCENIYSILPEVQFFLLFTDKSTYQCIMRPLNVNGIMYMNKSETNLVKFLQECFACIKPFCILWERLVFPLVTNIALSEGVWQLAEHDEVVLYLFMWVGCHCSDFSCSIPRLTIRVEIKKHCQLKVHPGGCEFSLPCLKADFGIPYFLQRNHLPTHQAWSEMMTFTTQTLQAFIKIQNVWIWIFMPELWEACGWQGLACNFDDLYIYGS